MAVQMTCPFCKKEFPYDNGWIDKEISIKGQRITEINGRLAEIKALGRERWDKHTWRRRCSLVKELTGLQTELSHLKAIRKACDQQRQHYEYIHFKEYVRDRFGETEYRKALDAALKETEAYSAKSLMQREYTRSPSKSNVTNINKL